MIRNLFCACIPNFSSIWALWQIRGWPFSPRGNDILWSARDDEEPILYISFKFQLILLMKIMPGTRYLPTEVLSTFAHFLMISSLFRICKQNFRSHAENQTYLRATPSTPRGNVNLRMPISGWIIHRIVQKVASTYRPLVVPVPPHPLQRQWYDWGISSRHGRLQCTCSWGRHRCSHKPGHQGSRTSKSCHNSSSSSLVEGNVPESQRIHSPFSALQEESPHHHHEDCPFLVQ